MEFTGLKSGSKIQSLRMLGTLGLRKKYTFLMALPLRVHADVQDRVLDSSSGTSSKPGGSIFMLFVTIGIWMMQLDKMENNNYTIQIDRSIMHDYYEQARKWFMLFNRSEDLIPIIKLYHITVIMLECIDSLTLYNMSLCND